MLLEDPAYHELSDADKLRELEYKAAERSVPDFQADNSWAVIYHSNFYINYSLFRKAMGLVVDRLQAGITSFSQIEVRGEL